MTPSRHAVRPATAADADSITQILGRGFLDDPPLKWILPDAAERPHLSPRFFRPFVDLVLAQGQAFVTEDHAGAALWLHVDVTAQPDEDPAEFHQLFIDGIGEENTKRFRILDELFTARHPGQESHAYLLFVGAVPEKQNQGVGTALLQHRLGELDQEGCPAYLEASCERSTHLYSRLGFAMMGAGLTLPDGPTLYPMWRPPAGPAATIQTP